MCTALGELHTWEALLFSAPELPDVGEFQPTQTGAWVTQPNTVMCHTPWKQAPKPPTTLWGEQSLSPPPFRRPFKKTRVKGHRGWPSQRAGHPQNHTQASQLLMDTIKEALPPAKAPLGVSLCHRVPGRSPSAL